ncbi:MAG: hypothetical protein E6J31_02235 [Chloroflexi bacterium]|nr:MAG: hypothetical protein E6J31_02235 [Chloroflexota bacterium]
MLKGGQRGRGTQSTTNFLRVLTSAEVATIFSSVSTSLNQLGTRVLHTKVARSHLVDLVNIVLSSSHSSNRVIIGASLEFRPPFVTHPRYMSGVKHTFMLFSAAQRHAAWDMRSTIRQEIVEEKCIAISSFGRWQRKRTDTAIFDAPFSNGYPK